MMLCFRHLYRFQSIGEVLRFNVLVIFGLLEKDNIDGVEGYKEKGQQNGSNRQVQIQDS